MPCWSGVMNVVAKVVLLSEVDVAGRRRRWNGDSILNSSCTASAGGGLYGAQWSLAHCEIVMEKCCVNC